MREGGERESVKERERTRECFRTMNTLQAVKAAQITGLIDYRTHSSWQVHPPLHPSIPPFLAAGAWPRPD